MTADQFNQWLSDMRAKGLITSDKSAADLLGVTDDTIVKYKRKGAKKFIGLACTALYYTMEPYGD